MIARDIVSEKMRYMCPWWFNSYRIGRVSVRGHPFMTSTRKSGFYLLLWTSTCRRLLLVYIEEKFPLFIPSEYEILVQENANFFA